MGRIEEATAHEVPVISQLIKQLPLDQRPRERLLQQGAGTLKDEELIAILLRTGIKGRSAIQVALDLLHDHNNDLNQLARSPVELLAKTKGVGKTKALQLRAALELAGRVNVREAASRAITEPSHAADLLRDRLRNADREHFFVLLLNTKNHLIKLSEVSRGTVNASLVEPREVFKEAFLFSATSVILAHNHPSGDPTPSSEDIAITKRLAKAGELLNITVHDHLIIGHPGPLRSQDYVSLRELGLM